MDPKLYESKRNELVGLINETLAIQDLPDATSAALNQIRKKALENQFEITLVAEFGGGKSTTLNALCDGREIAPRGFGLKTSGCLVSAQNISDPNEPEGAEIAWREKDQLALLLVDLLRERLSEMERFNNLDNRGIVSALDLENSADRGIVRGLLNDEWAKYKANAATYNPDQLDVLRVASLIIGFLGSTAYEKLKSKTHFSLEEARTMMAFPTGWAPRWGQNDWSVFRLEEIAFVFIARVRCRLHSKNLERIGCVVTDCPGLFASAWDTDVALQAMFNADGIWYLVNGATQIGQSTQSMVQDIVKRGWQHKLFFSINLKNNTKNIILNNIRPADLQTLNGLGLNLRMEDVRPYHAALALRGVQGRRYLENKPLDAGTEAVICADAKSMECVDHPVTDALCKMIEDHLHVLKVPVRHQVTEWGEKAVAAAETESNLDPIFEAIAKRAIDEKAHSILIHNGPAKVVDALLEYEGQLKRTERLASKKRDEFEAKVCEAEKTLKAFECEAQERIKDLQSISVAELTENLFNEVVLEPVGEVVSRAAKRITNEVISIKRAIVAVVSEKERESIDKAITYILRDEYEKEMSACLISWLGNIKRGKNKVYNATISDMVKRTNSYLHKRWELVASQEILDDIQLAGFTGDYLFDDNLFVKAAKIESLNATSLDVFLDGKSIKELCIAVGKLCGWIIFIYDIKKIGKTIEEIRRVLNGDAFKENISNNFRDQMRQNIDANLTRLRSEIIDGCDGKEGIKALTARFRDVYVNLFRENIAETRKKYQHNVNNSRESFKNSESERIEAAAKAKERREGIIEPIRKKVESFKSDVISLLEKTAQPNHE